MIVQYHEPRKQRMSMVIKSYEEEAKTNDTERTIVKKMSVPTAMAFEVPKDRNWLERNWQNRHEDIVRPLKFLSKSDTKLKEWESQLKINPFLIKQIPCSLIRQPIPSILRQRVYLTMLPNHQYITDRLFQLSRRRGRTILDKKVQAFETQSTLFLISEDLSRLFSPNFYQSNQQLMKELENLMAAFCVHRLEVGQKRCLARLAVLLHCYLNRNPMQTFVHLCHIVCSRPYNSLIQGSERSIGQFLVNVQAQLEDNSTVLSVLFARQFPKLFGQYVIHWVRNLFICVFFDDTAPYLDCLYNLQAIIGRQDFVLDRIFNYLFLKKFSGEALCRICISLIMSLQRALLREATVESLAQVLHRPKYHMDMIVFDTYLY